MWQVASGKYLHDIYIQWPSSIVSSDTNHQSICFDQALGLFSCKKKPLNFPKETYLCSSKDQEMESNSELLNLGITNEELGKQSLSDEKLELRLGPPTTQVVQNQANSLVFSAARFGNFSSLSSTPQNRIFVQDDERVVNNGFMVHHPINSPSSDDNTTIPNCSHKRVAPSSVIGWPPVRSFRKKMALSNSNLKPPLDPNSKGEDKGELKMVKNSSLESKDQQFVKINMDGVPIGRKVNLRKYDNYESLSSAVDQLFRGLLAAQEGGWAATEQEDRKEITGLLDGSNEYTLVYEDNEGDRVLVGDVPWNMFLSTVKRLRVLKSSELGSKHG